ncbi:Protein of unknown function [Pyronema omphalodes CBS 100304]|uniref:Uncharacterized protein n=1 Tax=Pyronema omphalodes (strain CBS 100304) TaxID=1076935 RepID=U4KV63_PYROM|nr:Protein of unknown function [Pyronema omphalodes CBS 100304]
MNHGGITITRTFTRDVCWKVYRPMAKGDWESWYYKKATVLRGDKTCCSFYGDDQCSRSQFTYNSDRYDNLSTSNFKRPKKDIKIMSVRCYVKVLLAQMGIVFVWLMLGFMTINGLSWLLGGV